MKYYLGGPMTDYPEYNFPEFERVTGFLRALGYEVVSAHEVDHGETPENRGTTKSHAEYLKGDLIAMLGCDAVIFHGMFQQSEGAQLELMLARALGMEVFEFCGCSQTIHRL